MPDRVTVTNGGAPFEHATDEVDVNGQGLAHVPYVKLVGGANGDTTPIPGTASGLGVVPRVDVLPIRVAAAGLTNVAYTAGDQVGTQFTLANAARVSGGTGRITNVVLIDQQDIIGAYDVMFFRASTTLAADNAAFSISDADAINNFVGVAQLPGAVDIGGNRVAQATNLSIRYDCAATSLFAALICRFGHGGFPTAALLTLLVTVERD